MKPTFLLVLALLLFAGNACLAQIQRDSIVQNNPALKVPESHFGKNIISLSPLQFLNNGNIEVDNHEGFGFAIERIILNGYAGLSCPVNFKKKNAGFYLMPVFRIYPTGQGVAKFSLGPQVIITHLEDRKPPIDSRFAGSDIVRKQIGLGLNVHCGTTIFKHLYISFEASAGKILQDSFWSAAYLTAKDGTSFINIGGSAGYRF
ncbi:MAG: hypothetical protein IT257_01410 [Chitinophagaceae bacterium]|nr:hypothetical protein [Chitinophagaceae bacterium]